MKQTNERLGPLIGIVASKKKRDDFYGNRSLFKRIQYQLQQTGGLSFVMTSEGIKEYSIEGFIYDKGEWRKAIFPLPDIIYNRIATYRAEKGAELRKVRTLTKKHQIPFYNPHFFDKWEIYKQLKEIELLKKYLPVTEKLENANQLVNWLQKETSVFIKPVLSNQGQGITSLSLNKESFKLTSNSGSQVVFTTEEIWKKLQERLTGRPAIIQKHILLKKYQELPYDLRILVQRVKDKWAVSGIGVRLAKQGAITTHVPQGGRIIPLSYVDQQLNKTEIEELTSLVAYQLEKAYGYLCEFSVDLGVDENNKLWIFEVNAKPMKFDEPQIKEKAIKTLIECFTSDAGF